MNTNQSNQLTEEAQIIIEQNIDLKDNASVLKQLCEGVTLSDVKNEIALEKGFKSWDYLIAANLYNEKLRDEVSERYADSKLSAYKASRN